MLIVIDKETNELMLTTNELPKSGEGLSDIFPSFDETKMATQWLDGESLPEFFEIVSGKLVERSVEERINDGTLELSSHEKVVDGKIVQKTLEELVEEGVYVLDREEKIENGAVVNKTLSEMHAEGNVELDEPFEFIDGDQIKERSLSEILSNNLLVDMKSAQKAKTKLYKQIARDIRLKYSPSDELKLSKQHTQWIAEGMPEGDERARKFDAMEQYIASVKLKYTDMKSQINAILGRF